jgi:hypothetical protein
MGKEMLDRCPEPDLTDPTDLHEASRTHDRLYLRELWREIGIVESCISSSLRAIVSSSATIRIVEETLRHYSGATENPRRAV